jgi:hypothetical protein
MIPEAASGSERARPALALLLLVPLLLAGCGGDVAGESVTTAPTATSEPAAAPDELVLRVDSTGRFVTPTTLATRLPVLSLYGDGRVITEGPQVESYPPPALPNVMLSRVPPTDVDRLVQAALDAGVGDSPDLGQPPVADATSTRFSLRTGSGMQVVEAYALAETPAGAPGLTPAQRAARKELQDLLNGLTDLNSILGDGTLSAGQPYVPTALAAVATPYVDPGEPAQAEQEWFGPPLPGAPLGSTAGLTCVVMGADYLGHVEHLSNTATAATPWTYGGKRWSVALRPLLPDESGCEDLAHRP